jgi:hypothetical protein
MASATFWSSACLHAKEAPMRSLLHDAYASYGVTVRCACCAICAEISSFDAAQIALFCVSAVAGGVMFYRWRRMEEEDRRRVWRLYGWFTALMACGSCVGAVAWAARMMELVNDVKAIKSVCKAEEEAWAARAYSWLPVFQVTYAVEFMCMCSAKLMVLDRMYGFVAAENAQQRWAAVARVVMAAVVLGNAVGLAANAAAAVHYQKAAEAESASSNYFSVNNTKDGRAFNLLSDQEVQLAGSLASLQLLCEVTVLLLIVVAFVVVGVLCARILSSTFTTAGRDVVYDALMATVGGSLRRQMLGTTAFVFVTFLLRSVYTTMQSVSFMLRDIYKRCPDVNDLCDASCYNVYTHISIWMNYTPEFQSTIVLISSPLALLVALWGMTPRSTLHLMNARKRDTGLACSLMQAPESI